MRRKDRKRLKGSSTAGKDKGLNYRKHELKTRLAKDSKFHKTDPKNYKLAEDLVRSLNK
jgi:hypothetical protein